MPLNIRPFFPPLDILKMCKIEIAKTKTCNGFSKREEVNSEKWKKKYLKYEIRKCCIVVAKESSKCECVDI